MKKPHEKLGLIFALTLGASAAANGAVFYNNLPSNLNALIPFGLGGDGVTTYRDHLGGLASLSSDGYISNKFLADSNACQSGCLLGVTLAFNSSLNIGSNPNPYTDGYQLQIFNNAQGLDALQNPIDLPGSTLLGTLTGSGNFPNPSQYYQFTGVVTLAANTNYWVKVSPTANVRNGVESESFTWNSLLNDFLEQSNPSQPAESLFVGLGGGAPSSLSAIGETLLMKVETLQGADVPVPGALWLMGSGLLGIMTSWRKKILN